MEEIKHYIQNADNANAAVIDIESFYQGLLYAKCEGLEAKGKRKNIYTEEYSDSDELRVWMGEDVCRAATTISFTFYFVGKNRAEVMEKFYQDIKNGRFYYWDTKRLRKCLFVVIDEYKPSEDFYTKSTPYKKLDLKVQNLWGESKQCTEKGVLI